MRNRSTKPIIFLAIVMVVNIALVSSIFAQGKSLPSQSSPTKGKSTGKSIEKPSTTKSEKPGYCCSNGEIKASSRTDCKDEGDIYFSTKREANRKCRGFCCVKGSGVLEVSKAVCIKKHHGGFFTNKRDADLECRGFCCVKGSITQSFQNECSRLKGTYFMTRENALNLCKGWCCAGLEVTQEHPKQCALMRGRYFGTEQEAKDNCKKKKAYCNVSGKTLQLSQIDCKNKKGSFYTTRAQAQSDLKKQSFSGIKSLKKPSGKEAHIFDGQIPPAHKKIIKPFGFIHPRSYEEFNRVTPRFSWWPHPFAQKYFLRIMKTSAGGAGSHVTIWEKGNLNGTHVDYNSDGSAAEPLVAGTEYRANLYARRSSHGGTPDNDPADYIQMTGDVVFTVNPLSMKPLPAVSIKKSATPLDTKQPPPTPKAFSGRKEIKPAAAIPRQPKIQMHAPLFKKAGVDEDGIPRQKAILEMAVSSPNGGEHWLCSGGRIVWYYAADDSESLGEITNWNVELLVNGEQARPPITSRCEDYTDFEDMYNGRPIPSPGIVRECTERLTAPCLPTGNYTVRVAGGSFSDESDSAFRIGVSEDWPMITISSPTPGNAYEKFADLPIQFYSTAESPFDVDVLIAQGSVAIPVNEEDCDRWGSCNIHLDNAFAPGDDHKIIVRNRRNPDNYVISDNFTILPAINSLAEGEPYSSQVSAIIINGPYSGATGASAIDTIYWWNEYSVSWRRVIAFPGEVEFFLVQGDSNNRVRILGSDYDDGGRIVFTAPSLTGRGFRILAVSMHSNDIYAMSNEFSISAPSLNLTAPKGGTWWRNGDLMEIRWETGNLPRRNPESAQEMTLSIFIENVDIDDPPLCIVRQLPVRGATNSFFYGWGIGLKPTRTFSETGSPDGTPPSFGGEGRLGGVDKLMIGDYRIILRLDQGGLISIGDVFHIDKSPFQRFRDTGGTVERKE